MTITIPTLWLILIGLCLGSFLNVVILRDDKRQSILNDRSRCMHCDHLLAWYDLFPLLSFLSLRGRCRYCQKPISWQYPTIEVLAALLLLFSFMIANREGGGLILAISLALVCLIMLVISIIDVRTLYIPLEYCIAAALIGVIGNLWSGHLSFPDVILGALLGGGVIAVILYGWKLIFHQEGMGTGDIWMAATIGAVVGYPLVGVALIFAFFVGALIGVLLMGTGQKTMQAALPFGPFLFIGMLIALQWGQSILQWYIL